MTPGAWKRVLGESAWGHICAGSDEDTTATVLSRASEVGFRGPAVAPAVIREGRAVLWPDSREPVLTADGLWAYWQSKGHGFLLLRAKELVESHRGPLLPRLQESMLIYEEHCRAHGVDPLPAWADLTMFVGGSGAHTPGASDFLTALSVESPEPTRQRVAVVGPGARQ